MWAKSPSPTLLYKHQVLLLPHTDPVVPPTPPRPSYLGLLRGQKQLLKTISPPLLQNNSFQRSSETLQRSRAAASRFAPAPPGAECIQETNVN